MKKNLQKKLLSTALTITSRHHWHTVFFWLLEKYSDLAEEIANEHYRLPPEEEKEMLEEILRKGKLEIALKEILKGEGEAVTPPTPEERPDCR